MNELDRMLRSDTSPDTALPPLVRDCKRYKEAGDRIEVELYRQDASSGLSGAELVIHRWVSETPQDLRQVEWDDGINSGLVELGLRAIDLGQEGDRFALGLRAALRRVERRYGDGYLNSVLVDLLDESNLANDGELAEVRQYIHVNSPERSRNYDACRELIANEIGGRAAELRDKLRYGPDEVKSVMTKALAIYLDERFSVSRRRSLGWL